jgi:putative copper resistance protein D
MTSASPAGTATRASSLGSRLGDGPRRRVAGYATALVGAGAAALIFGLWGNVRPRPQVIHLAGPGAVTEWGLPIARLAVDVSMIGTVGMLGTAILLPRMDGAFSAEAGRCLRSAGRLALAWAVSTVAMLVLLWSDASQVPLVHLTPRQLFSGPYAFPGAMSYLFGAVLAVIVSAAARVTRTVRGVVVVLLLAAYDVLPVTTLGHEGESPLVGPVVTVHVVAVSLWAGTLAGLLVHARRSPELLAVALPRFGRLALICLVAVAVSGLAAGWLNVGSVFALRNSHYGMLVIYKSEALAGLGFLTWWYRSRTVSGAAGRHAGQTFTRFAAIEVAALVAATSLGVALSRAPAPVKPAPPPPSSVTYTGVAAPAWPAVVGPAGVPA